LRCRGGPRSPARTVPRAEPATTARHTTPTIGELMTRAVRTVTADTSIESLVTLLLERGISAVPVVDADGKPIGIVSKTDLLRRYYDDGGTAETSPSAVQTADGVELDLGAGFHAVSTGDASVADVMTPRVLTLPEDAHVGQAAAVMAFEGIHRLLVVTPDGGIAGILSSLDILRWLASDTGFVVPEVGHVQGPRS